MSQAFFRLLATDNAPNWLQAADLSNVQLHIYRLDAPAGVFIPENRKFIKILSTNIPEWPI